MPIVLEEGQRFPGTGPLPALCPFMVSLRTAMAPAGVSFSHRATLNTYEAHGSWEATSSAILDLVGSQRVLLFLLTQMSFFSRLCPALFSLVSIRLWAAGVSG